MCHQRDIQMYVELVKKFIPIFQDTSYRWENLDELFGKPNGKLGPQNRQIISLPFCAIPFQGVIPVQTLGLTIISANL